jgi:hypothetical protein
MDRTHTGNESTSDSSSMPKVAIVPWGIFWTAAATSVFPTIDMGVQRMERRVQWVDGGVGTQLSYGARQHSGIQVGKGNGRGGISQIVDRNVNRLNRSDRTKVTDGSLKYASRGTETADELLHRTLEGSNTWFPRRTGSGGVVEGWCQGRKRGRFDGGGRDGGRKLLHTTLYCRVPSTRSNDIIYAGSATLSGTHMERKIRQSRAGAYL